MNRSAPDIVNLGGRDRGFNYDWVDLMGKVLAPNDYGVLHGSNLHRNRDKPDFQLAQPSL